MKPSAQAPPIFQKVDDPKSDLIEGYEIAVFTVSVTVSAAFVIAGITLVCTTSLIV